LGQFVSRQGPLGVGDITETLGLNKSQASKVLKTFRDFGFLVQDPDSRKYSVGLNAFALGNRYVNANPLSREALPIMRKLVDESGHSAVLTVIHNGDVIHLLAVEGRMFVDGRWRVGRWMPYHTTSAGKVLLAFGPDSIVDHLIKTRGLPRVTPNTITNVRQFKQVLGKARTEGIAVTRSENFPGTAALSVPVFDQAGRAVAALGLICPEHLLTREEETRLAAPLHRAARALSFRMGAQIYPFGD
jgi:DNA-binding IclR family transcriptional regulator